MHRRNSAQSMSLTAGSLAASQRTAKAPLRFTTLPVAGRARSRTAGPSDDDRSNLDAVNRRRCCAGDNDADGGRTITIHGTQTAKQRSALTANLRAAQRLRV